MTLMTMAMAMAMAMAMPPQVVPCADFNKNDFLKSRKKTFLQKNTKIEQIWPRDQGGSIDLDERIFFDLTRAP